MVAHIRRPGTWMWLLLVASAVSFIAAPASAQVRRFGGGITVYTNPDFAGESATFHNSGEYVKEAGAGVSDVLVPFDNSGMLRVGAGTVRLTGGIQQTQFGALTGGTWYIGAGATLDTPSNSFSNNTADITLAGPGATICGD